MSGRRPRTLVVAPAYGEEDAIEAALEDVANEQPDLDVVVIDDVTRGWSREQLSSAPSRVHRLGIGSPGPQREKSP